MFIYIDRENDPLWIAANFENKENALTWFNGLKPELHKHLSLEERPDLSYPFYIIWDFNNPDIERHFRCVTEQQADSFMQGIRRDKEWEKKVEEDSGNNQYFYLGIVNWDGEMYKFAHIMGRDNKYDYGHYDHDHVTGWRVQRYQSIGFKNTYWSEERINAYRRMRHTQRKFRYLVRLNQQNILQNKKNIERLKKRIDKFALIISDWRQLKRKHEEWRATQRPFAPAWMQEMRKKITKG
jgi:hypothetical protein